MATLRKWQKKLTAKERRHLTDTGGSSLDAIRRNREAQRQMKAEDPDGREPCWTCRDIARKLGMED